MNIQPVSKTECFLSRVVVLLWGRILLCSPMLQILLPLLVCVWERSMVHTCVCAGACTYACMWRSEQGVLCLSLLLSASLPWDKVSHWIEHLPSRLGWPMSSWDPLSSLLMPLSFGPGDTGAHHLPPPLFFTFYQQNLHLQRDSLSCKDIFIEYFDHLSSFPADLHKCFVCRTLG